MPRKGKGAKVNRTDLVAPSTAPGRQYGDRKKDEAMLAMDLRSAAGASRRQSDLRENDRHFGKDWERGTQGRYRPVFPVGPDNPSSVPLLPGEIPFNAPGSGVVTAGADIGAGPGRDVLLSSPQKRGGETVEALRRLAEKTQDPWLQSLITARDAV